MKKLQLRVQSAKNSSLYVESVSSRKKKNPFIKEENIG